MVSKSANKYEKEKESFCENRCYKSETVALVRTSEEI